MFTFHHRNNWEVSEYPVIVQRSNRSLLNYGRLAGPELFTGTAVQSFCQSDIIDMELRDPAKNGSLFPAYTGTIIPSWNFPSGPRLVKNMFCQCNTASFIYFVVCVAAVVILCRLNTILTSRTAFTVFGDFNSFL